MREILFRGKLKNYSEWVEGWFVGKSRKAPYNPPKEKPQIIDQDLYSYEVIPETVGQYTGIEDRNGNKIFEGDIVSFKRVNALGYTTERVGEVKYYSKLPIFYIFANTGDAWDWCDCENIKVIGNIHDNPELLSKE